MEKERKKQLALRTEQLSDTLYNFIDDQIQEHGSFKNYVEHVAERDRQDKLGHLFSEFKSELKQEIVDDVKTELSNLKHFIKEQLQLRTVTTDTRSILSDEEEQKNTQLYDIKELKITGRIDEDTNVDY